MNKTLISFIFLNLFFTSCNPEKNIDLSDPIDSGRGFIEASLKGNYNDAGKYLLQDTTNIKFFDRMKLFYADMKETEKDSYKNANIIINATDNLSDSVAILNYSNTYKNKPSRLKMVRINNKWLVDFKYAFTGNL